MLLLMPAGVLIVLVLGALAVDAAIVYLGERQAANLSASVANDAAALLDDGTFYRQDLVCLDPAAVEGYVTQRLITASDERFRVALEAGTAPAPSSVRVEGSCAAGSEQAVVARVVAEVPLLFSRALPGRDVVVVDAETRVRLAGG